MAEIVVPYKPREAFLPYHESNKRWSVTVAHRRAGKTVARINKLIMAAMLCELQNPRFGYLAPYYVQAKDIAWLYLKHYCEPLIALGGKVNESELSVTLPYNNAIIKLYGAENAERMRGLYFDGIVVDEAQGIAQSVLTTIILPALADRQGWLDVSGTPKGWVNLLGALVKSAKDDPTWYLQILRASETGIIPPDELSKLRALMSENEYEQEFECSFDAAITGAVYGQQIAECDKAGRIKPGLYDPSLPVNSAWDLGYDDSTAIWFWQLLHGEIRLIGYYENNGQDIVHYCDELKSRPYTYGKHYVPHDAANKSLAAGGRSIYQQMLEQGLKGVEVVAATSQQNGIEAARKTLEICWFDTDAAQGTEALRNYQFEWDDDKKTFRSKPRHDWSSHAADAFEIIAQVWRKQVVEVIQPPIYRTANNATFKDLLEQSRKQRLRAEDN